MVAKIVEVIRQERVLPAKIPLAISLIVHSRPHGGLLTTGEIINAVPNPLFEGATSPVRNLVAKLMATKPIVCFYWHGLGDPHGVHDLTGYITDRRPRGPQPHYPIPALR